MGFNPFKSKKKTKVDTEVMRVVEDKELPETLKQSIVRYVLGEDKELTDEILNGFIEGSAPKFDRMFNYAKDHYPYGLPNVTHRNSQDGKGVVKAVIEGEIGAYIDMVYFHFGELNANHFGREYLQKEYAYNPTTNEVVALSKEKGEKVYVKEIVAHYTQNTFDQADGGLQESWGLSGVAGENPSQPLNGVIGRWVAQVPYVVDPDINRDKIVITLEWRDTKEKGVVFKEDTLEVPFPSGALESGFFQVCYTEQDNPNEYVYWTYENGSLRYPAIEEIHDEEYKGNGTYFPFVFFRSYKKNLSDKGLRDTELHEASSKILDYLGMDYTQMGKEIHKNESVDDVEQAVLWMGVPLKSQDAVEKKYLFHYFRHAYFAGGGNTRGRTLSIRDRDFRLKLGFDEIRYSVKAGKVTDVGKVVSSNISWSRVEEYWQPVVAVEKEWEFFERRIDSVGMKWQMQVSESHYEEVVIRDPRLKYEIWKGKSVTADRNDGRFLVPIDQSISNSFSLPEREILYSRSLHLVFNSRITYEVKWYEQSWFRNVLIIAAVVLTIASFGTTWEAIVAAYAVGGVIAVVTTIAIDLAIRYAISEATKIFVKEIGAEAAFLIALASMVYAGGKSIQHGSIAGAPWASELMALSTSISSSIQNHTEDLISGVQDEYSTFMSEGEKKLKDLSEAKELLDVSSLVDPMSYVKMEPLFIIGESPDNFYDRTVHSGNIGVRGTEMIENYVRLSLQLPKPYETLQGVTYE